MPNYIVHDTISVINMVYNDEPPIYELYEVFEVTAENIEAYRKLNGMDLYFPLPVPDPIPPA